MARGFIRRPLPTLLAVLAAAGLQAQAPGSLRVEVRDGQGRPRAGAEVLVEGKDFRRTYVSDAQGLVHASGLAEGEYRVEGRSFRVKNGQETRLALRGARSHATVQVLGDEPKVAVRSTAGSKLDLDLRDVPQSVTAVPEAVLEEQGAQRLDRAMRAVSGMVPSSTSNYGFHDNHLVRGLPVTYSRDGIPDGTTYQGYLRSTFDVAQLEVVKGPGSAVLGSAGPGGNVNLTSRKPQREAAARAELFGGSWGQLGAMGDLTGAMGDKGAFRVIADGSKTDGFRDLKGRTFEVLPSFAWDLGNQTLGFKVEYRRVQQAMDAAGTPFRPSDNKILDVDKEAKYFTPFADSKNEIWRGVLSHEVRFTGDYVLHQNLVYSRRKLDLDRNFREAFIAPGSVGSRNLRDEHDTFRDWMYQVEPTWRLSLGSVQHLMLFGVELHNQDIDANRAQATLPNIADAYHPNPPETSLGALNFVPQWHGEVEGRQQGFYVQDQMSFGEHWKARLSARRDHFKVADRRTLLNAAATDTRAKSLPVERNNWFWSGQAGLAYQPVPATSFFLGAAWGRYTNFTVEDPRTTYLPEGSRQVELGNKTTLADGRLSFTVAGFRTGRYDYTERLADGTAGVVPGQTTKGFDMDLTALPLPGWFLLVNYAHLDTTYDAALSKAPADQIQGKRTVGSPREVANLWTSYELQGGPLKGLGFGGGATHRSDVYVNNVNTQQLPAYTIFDATAFYRRDRWEARILMKNLSDKTYYTHGVIASGVPGEGRSFFASVSTRF